MVEPKGIATRFVMQVLLALVLISLAQAGLLCRYSVYYDQREGPSYDFPSPPDEAPDDTGNVDCLVTEWTEWSSCSAPCVPSGLPIHRRYKTVDQHGLGAPCPSLEEQRTCNTDVPCQPFSPPAANPTEQPLTSGQCSLLPDGNYANGPCESAYFSCVGGETINHFCYDSMVYDATSDSCQLPSNTEGCTGTRPTATVPTQAPTVSLTNSPAFDCCNLPDEAFSIRWRRRIITKDMSSLLPARGFPGGWWQLLSRELHVGRRRMTSNQFGIKLIDRELSRILFAGRSERHLPLTRVLPLMKDIESVVGKAKLAEHLLPPAEDQGSEKPTALTNGQLLARNFPKLQGADLNEHFWNIATKQAEHYKRLLSKFAKASLPPRPSTWSLVSGWTAYRPNGQAVAVDFPADEALVFDVEVCVPVGQHPILAVAVSDTAWYSWCSPRLCESRYYHSQEVCLKDLIPLESASHHMSGQPPANERIVIGHNVSFDRSYVREQYSLKGTKLRFWDTMSMHIAVCGLAGDQRTLFMAARRDRKTKATEDALGHTGAGFENSNSTKKANEFNWKWLDETTTNSLAEVHRFHCVDSSVVINKDLRSVFMNGTLEDVRNEFQTLTGYCATDVLATFEVFSKLMSQFWERFPHPVTTAGMLEMGNSYLPTNTNWHHYLKACESTFNMYENQIRRLLFQRAIEICRLNSGERYKDDPWFWSEDWSIKTEKKKKVFKKEPEESAADFAKRIWESSAKLKNSANVAPAWFRSLCATVKVNAMPWDESCEDMALDDVTGTSSSDSFKITSQMRITPKLLRMHWNGYPLHYSAAHGWGYLVPGRTSNLKQFPIDAEGRYVVTIGTGANRREVTFPYKKIEEFVMKKNGRIDRPMDICWSGENERYMLNSLSAGSSIDETPIRRFSARKAERKANGEAEQAPMKAFDAPADFDGIGPFNDDVNLPGVWFYKLPHGLSPMDSVSNPLSKAMFQHIEEGRLQSSDESDDMFLAKMHRICSYWKNSNDRILSQIVVNATAPEAGIDAENALGYAAILPRVVCAGTVTRRAVEPTWLTISNPENDRLGSELKGLIQAPEGYTFVGADADSQELWIAALFGDSYQTKVHGSTPLSWMLLNGSKENGTDQHSLVASDLGITRQQAKILNYGRIYGAGLPFAIRVIKTFCPDKSKEEIYQLAMKLYSRTKGKPVQMYRLTRLGRHLVLKAIAEKIDIPLKRSWYLAQEGLDDLLSLYASKANVQEIVREKVRVWTGGSESDLFNSLEETARAEQPITPVLGCRISRALEPDNVKSDFLTSRINWVVQSSAVDYLHLMLTSMRWLCETYKIDARFSISFHDEVRYIASNADRYRTALALQITNLLTRSMFVHCVGMCSLPESVAYFTSVDIDRVLRKEVDIDCCTPSNPLGLSGCYEVPQGQALNIDQIMELTKGSLEPVNQRCS